MRSDLLMAALLIFSGLKMAGVANNKDTCVMDEKIAMDVSDCDTIVQYEGYNIHIIKKDGKLVHAGLNLFSDEEKHSMDKELINRLETELMNLCLNDTYDKLSTEIVAGSIGFFKSVSPQTQHTLTNSDSREVSAEWITKDGQLKVKMPINYDMVKGGSRTEIEDKFISGAKEFSKHRSAEALSNLQEAVPFADTKYMIPGPSYQNNSITRNIFIESDSEMNPVWDVDFPKESIANLFIFPNDKYGDRQMTITVLKHEYGEKEIFTVNVENFLAYCQVQGCLPFWGVEKYADEKLEGALFLFNQGQGYDHVLKIDCCPKDVISGKGTITARASLFVPTNNVSNLFQPYIKKSEEEKIRYDK